jgi:hypothetical protein
MKLSFARIFIPDTSVDEAVLFCDMLKGEGQSKLTLEWGNYDSADAQKSFVRHELTGRLSLQRYGTEAHRDVFGTDFWVDVLLPLTIDDYERVPTWTRNFMGQLDQKAPEICVITDTRFENEAQRVRDLGGKIWEIHRGGQKVEDGHVSEMPLPPDLIDKVIYNSYEGELRQFEADVREELERLVGE